MHETNTTETCNISALHEKMIDELQGVVMKYGYSQIKSMVLGNGFNTTVDDISISIPQFG